MGEPFSNCLCAFYAVFLIQVSLSPLISFFISDKYNVTELYYGVLVFCRRLAVS
jgi:hypothetical protein